MARKRGISGTGTIRLRSDGRWEARIPGSPNKPKYFRTQTEAQKWLTAACADINIGQFIEPSKLTLASWLTKWLDTYVIANKDSTYSYYEQAIRLRITPYIGKIRLQDLNQMNIQMLTNKLEADYAIKTIRNTIGMLHCALEKARENGLIRKNPCEGVTLPKEAAVKMAIMSQSQFAAFWEAVQLSDIKNELLLMILSGLRKGELTGLTWDCVDFVNKELHVYRQYIYDKKTLTYGFETPKNSKPRTIALPDAAIKVFHEQQAKQAEMASAAGSLWSNDENFIFTNCYGKPMSATTLHKHFKEICRQIGTENMRIHDLRHNFATYALQAGVDIKTLQETLGHSSAAFTMKQYAHSTMEMKHAAAEKMDALLADINADKDKDD